MAQVPASLLRSLVERACRAPSVHNTQPWRWTLTRTGVSLYADRNRRLMHTDPRGRDLVMSCGAALHTLVVAAAGEGLRARVQHLPDADDPDHLASIRFVPSTASGLDRDLAAAVVDRRTDRRPPSSWPVPAERLIKAAELASRHGVRATEVPETGPVDVHRIVLEAQRIQGFDRGYHDELLAYSQTRQGAGVPAANVPERHDDTDLAAPRFPSGALPATAPGGRPSPAWLLLSTSSDDALSWLRAGIALQAVWLWATVERMAVVPYSQPFEVDRTRLMLQRDLLDDSSCPQLLLRLGWPPLAAAPVPATPRRPLEEVLVSGSTA